MPKTVPCSPCGPPPQRQISPAVGEIMFGIVNNDNAPIAFELVSSGPLVVVGFPGFELQEASLLFDQPEDGTLRYVGDARIRARLSYSLTIHLAEEQGPIDPLLFLSAITRNDVTLPQSLAATKLSVAELPHEMFYAGQALSFLDPGDELQVLLSAFNVFDPTPQTNVVNLFQFSLMASNI